MKKILSLILLIIPIFILSGCNTSNKTNTSKVENIEISRTGTASNDTSLNVLTNDIEENNINNNISQNNTNNTTTENNINNTLENNINNELQNKTNTNVNEEPTKKEPVEKTLSEFSTPIKSKSSNRLNNIKITCSSLNGTSIKNGESFSFCNTVGKATESKGYKLADVIINKEVQKALGGGMCQVSTTLYNAALGVSNIKITERHPHGKAVNYVEEGKDAAVSHGSKDLKFINNTGNTIKIYANADNGKVYVKIVSIT